MKHTACLALVPLDLASAVQARAVRTECKDDPCAVTDIDRVKGQFE